MFKDYYAILETYQDATNEEIKAAFKQQAKKWHPDVNITKDTTIQMQNINEAYIILKDTEARILYDIEYNRYKQYTSRTAKKQNNTDYKDKSENSSNNYSVKDEILKEWIKKAEEQAFDLTRKMIKDITILSKEGVKAASSEIYGYIKIYFFMGIFFFIIFALVKSCN